MNKLQKQIDFLLENQRDYPIKHPDITESILQSYENQHQISIPNDYRFFLLQANLVDFGVLELSGILENTHSQLSLVETVKNAKEYGVPEGWFPFCYDNGDFYCILPDNTVRFWSHNGSTNEQWPNLATWIEEVWIGEAEEA